MDEIAKYFQSKGLMYKEYDHVKLHITVINSKYRREEVDTKDHQPSRVTFDASQILEVTRSLIIIIKGEFNYVVFDFSEIQRF